MKATKIIALLLASLELSALVACSGDQTPEDTTASTTGGEDTTAVTTPAETEPVYVAPDVDYDGEEFHFYTYNADSLKDNYFTDHYDGIFTEEENGDNLNDTIYQRNLTVEDELGCVIKNTSWTGNGETDSFTKNIMAGDDVYDMALGNINHISKIVSQTPDLLYDLAKIETLDLDSPWWDQVTVNEYNILGTQYAITGDLCLYNTIAVGCLYFNKEMVKAHNLSNPYELVDSGKWTIDTFLEMCGSVSADVNGDGTMDEKDRFGMSGSGTVMGQMLRASGLRVATKNDKGVAEFTLNNERTLTVVEKVVGLLRNRSMTMYTGDWPGDVTYDVFLPTFIDDRLLFHFNWLFMSYELREMQADFGILPFPKFDEEQENYYSYNAGAYTTVIMMPTTNTKYDMTGDVLDSMGYHSMMDVTPACIDSAVTYQLARDAESARMIEILTDSKVFEIYDLFGWGNIMSAAGNCVTENNLNFTSNYQSMIKAAEAALTATYAAFGK